MKRQAKLLISLLGVALLTSASVFAQGGPGGMGVSGGMVDSTAVKQFDRLHDRDQLRIHQDALITLDQDQDQDKDQLRTQDKDLLKLHDQDRDRVHVPQ